MRGHSRTCARTSSALRRAGSTFFRLKNPLVHSRIRRTVHVPPSDMGAILGRAGVGDNHAARLRRSASHRKVFPDSSTLARNSAHPPRFETSASSESADLMTPAAGWLTLTYPIPFGAIGDASWFVKTTSTAATERKAIAV